MLRRYLHRSGYRYRVNYLSFGKPDIVFPKKKIAIFIHGCFWHQHGCRNSVIPKTNSAFWKEKLNKNVLRDKKVTKELKRKQWTYKIIWECDIEDKFQNTITALVDFLYKAGVKDTIKAIYELPVKKIEMKIRNIAGDEIIIDSEKLKHGSISF